MRRCWIRLLYTCAGGTFLLTCSYLYMLEDQNLSSDGGQNRIGSGLGLQRIVAYAEDFFFRVQVHNCPGLVNKPFNVTVHNVVWQTMPDMSIFLFSAHYDSRLGEKRHFVRIIVSSLGRIDPNRKLYCQLRYGTNSLVVVVEAELTIIWSKIWDRDSTQLYYWPYLISCPVPLVNDQKVPYGVSLVTSPCVQAQNHLEISRPPSSPQKRDFAVCVKGLDFRQDMSHRLVEWIELQLLMGADVVDIYVYMTHPNMLNVLEHYHKLGKVRVQDLTLAGNQPNDPSARTRFIKRNAWQKRRNELVPYNDCFYRHIYSHHFVVLLDLDEAIIPLRHSNWKELIGYAVTNQPSAFSRYASIAVQNVYFFDEFPTADDPNIPAGAHMLRHVVRSFNFSRPGFAVKSFFLTNQTLTAFNHYALASLQPRVQRSILLSKAVAQLNHYRSRCPPNMETECSNNFLRYRKKDVSLWRWKEKLIERVERTLGKLDLKQPRPRGL